MFKLIRFQRCALLLLLVTPLVHPQNPDPISTERPSFSSSPETLANGLWQFEFGYQYSQDHDGAKFDEHTLPLLLIRTGLTDRLELQFNWAGYSWMEASGRTVHGGSDAGIGLKWQLSDEDAVTGIGLFAGLTLPAGSSDIGSDEAEPVLGIFWSHTERLSLFGTTLITESDHDTVISNAIGLNIPSSGNIGGYIEYVGVAREGSGPEHSLNAGVSFLRRSDLQFDASAGIGLNDRATDFYIGIGAARRF